MAKKYAWVATYHELDNDGARVIGVSTSLLTLQSHVMKAANKALKYHTELSDGMWDLHRTSRGNTITFELRYRDDDISVVDVLEWWVIKRSTLL